jgi:hypothetical protein
MKVTFTHHGRTIEGRIRLGRYKDGNVAVELIAEGGRYATLSTNTDAKLAFPEAEFVAKCYSENAGLNEQFIEQGLFENTGRTQECGYAGAQPVLRLTPKFITGAGLKAKREPGKPKITMDRILEAVEADDNRGFCTACGFEQGGCEPDTRGRECDSCGERKVYGAEELLIMGSG